MAANESTYPLADPRMLQARMATHVLPRGSRLREQGRGLRKQSATREGGAGAPRDRLTRHRNLFGRLHELADETHVHLLRGQRHYM